MGRLARTELVVTNKVRGIFATADLVAGVPVILEQIQLMQPRSEMIPTEMDLAWGINEDINQDKRLEIYLTVVDIDNIPEIGAIRSNNAWADMQKWQVSTGTFTIPTEVLNHLDPRFFRPKAWLNLEVGAAVRRMALVLIAFSNEGSDVQAIAMGTVRYTETLVQRVFGHDNAYSEVREGFVRNENDWDDDYGMQVYG